MKAMTRTIIIILSCSLSMFAYSANPFVTDIYTADPTARVFNDRLYVYTTHDEKTTTSLTDFDMRDWRLYSTDDMINWTDHGAILSLDDISWANEDAWANDVVYRDGTYYMYFPVNGSDIGVAISDNPVGPWTDPLGRPLINGNMTNTPILTIDPQVFIDDDGQAYLYFGQGWFLDTGYPRVVKLKDNMIELDGPILNVQGIPTYFEAPFVYKRNGKYYFTYSGDGLFSDILYAVGDHPLGPYEFKGEILHNTGGISNHHSIAEYKGQSYIFYHNHRLPDGGSHRRSVAVDRMHYNADGTIRPVKETFMGTAVSARVNVGETNDAYNDTQGRYWYNDSTDIIYSKPSKIYKTHDAISGTDDDELYQSNRYGENALFLPETLKYEFTIPNGDYTVILHFAELFFHWEGMRVFDIEIEGQTVWDDLDVIREVGHNAALVQHFDITVMDGKLEIKFLPGRNNPMVSAIEIVPVSDFEWNDLLLPGAGTNPGGPADVPISGGSTHPLLLVFFACLWVLRRQLIIPSYDH